LTKGTLRRKAAGAIGTAADGPDTGLHPGSHPGSRAELKELSDNALLTKVRTLPHASPYVLRDTRVLG
jgi:hypothetical protein